MDTITSSFQHTNKLMNITARPDLVLVGGQGSWIADHTGRRYLDFMQGWAVNSLGHSPAVLAQALAAQAQRLVSPSPAFYNEPSLQLAQRLIDSSCFDQVFFESTGAQANEGAIKLARKWGQQHKSGAFEIITFENGFHGRTITTMSASGKPGWDTMFAPQVPGFIKCTYNNIDSVRTALSERTVAIMLEPVLGEGGVVCAQADFVQALAKLCQEQNCLLIFDEVQTGMGRTGSLYAYQQLGVEPDIMTLGKGIGSGIPLAALLAKQHACVFVHGDQGGTYTGNPLMCAGGVAVFDVIAQPAFLQQVQRAGEHLSKGLQALSDRLQLRGETGSGLLRALLLDADYGAQVVRLAREEHALLVNSPRPNRIRLMPALNVTVEEIDLLLERLEAAIVQARAQS